MPSRRSFLHVLSASLVLGLPKGKLLAEYVNGSMESGDAVYGNYGFGQDHVIGLDHFTTDAGEDTLLFSDYQSGVVRRLFRVSDDQYVMGPGFAVQAPVELTLRLLRDSKGHVSRISLRSEDGVERIGNRLLVTREDIVFQDGDVRLAGTLISPTTVGPHPAIILLHGSGPLTRSSFGPYPYFFSSLGLSVLIYDKRGTGASTGTLMDASTGILMKPDDYYPNDIANDALAAFRFLQARKDIDQNRIGFGVRVRAECWRRRWRLAINRWPL